ncbi:unnamed protein product [Prorocentrum cordatum]|uniref:Uncharacterized protein n=1 Tax=Prorocentrum cordatum TaxID=2364126 RepID=A0ABN9X4U8_9DINO|nr:unnamed protein product [Polarella glacialis]
MEEGERRAESEETTLGWSQEDGGLGGKAGEARICRTTELGVRQMFSDMEIASHSSDLILEAGHKYAHWRHCPCSERPKKHFRLGDVHKYLMSEDARNDARWQPCPR